MHHYTPGYDMTGVSVSETDRQNGSPKEGDFIAVNKDDETDRWLVSKEFIEKNYEETEPETTHSLSFGAAVAAMKQGKRVARAGWNGKNLFVFMQVPADISSEIIPKMQSLPQSVKDEFARRGGDIHYRNQLAMVYPDNTIYGWVASPSDVLENDWCILD